jgi:hypothetical protein
MRRRVVNVLAGVSAVVCVLSLGVVGRSFFWSDALWVPIGQNNACGAGTFDGQVMLGHAPHSRRFEYFSESASEGGPALNVLWRDMTGIRWLGIGWGTPLGYTILILPLWVVPIVSAVLPVWWWRVRRRAGGRGFEVEVKGSSPAAEDAGDTG